jgi:hypothetical protein
MYPIYRALMDTMINVVQMSDSRFDLGNIDMPISNRSYVRKMVATEPYNPLQQPGISGLISTAR